MKINFLGDSITQGTGASSEENRYVDLVGKMLDIEVRNYGVGGTRFARQKKLSHNASYDYDFQMRMKIMAQMDGDADLVFVFGGTNDYGHGDAEIGNTNDNNPYTFYGAVNNVIDFLINQYGKEKICFLLPLPRYSQDELSARNNAKTKLPLSGYVEILKNRLNYYDIKYIDLFNGFMPIPQINTGDKYTVDGLHPNDLGHKLIANKVVEYVKNNIHYLI